MKKLSIFLLIVCYSYILSAQPKIDSLRWLLSIAKADTTIINLKNQIGAEFVEGFPDSAFKYGTEARALAQQIKYETGEIKALQNITGALTMSGNYSKALENAFEILKRSEQTGDSNLIASSLWSLGATYAFQGDNQQALYYSLQILKLYDWKNNKREYGRAVLNTGAAYFNLNQIDSSRYYLERSLEASTQANDRENLGAVYLNLGRINLKLKQYDSARFYFRQSLPLFFETSNHLFIYSTYYFIAEACDSLKLYDSAKYFSHLSLLHAQKVYSPYFIAEIMTQLSSLSKKTGNDDSAYYYLKMAVLNKDSAKKIENQKRIQTLIFNENLRQAEIAEQKKKDAETRKRNLELVGIAIFIPLFLLLVLSLGRKKVKSKTIEFLAVLGLLFFFEFIVLFAHPYIGHWTHESPIWMLLILVAIAAILVPLHHRAENWIKKKFLHKEDSIPGKQLRN